VVVRVKEVAGVELAEAKARLKDIEPALAEAAFVEFHAFERNGRR
jgi:hypothetical protein